LVIVIDAFVISYQLQVPCCASNFGTCSKGFLVKPETILHAKRCQLLHKSFENLFLK